MIKRYIALLVLLSNIALAQGIRIGDQTPTVEQRTIGGYPGILQTAPNAQINFCNSPVNSVPCTNYATTYTDQTLVTPCSVLTQVTLYPTNTCTANSDSNGNWGVWVPIGSYAYTVTVSGQSFGPYAAIAVLPVGNLWNGVIPTSLYANMQAAEAACITVPCLIQVNSAIAVTANDSPASTIQYWWTGGKVTVNNAVTWTMSGNTFIAPENQQIISLAGTGSIVGLKSVRPEWVSSSPSIRSAVAALDQTNGGTVVLRQATYRSGFEDNTQCGCGTNVEAVPNVTLQGAGRPLPNSTSTPTAFTANSGTIIQGTLNLGADHITIRDLGIDVGSTFVNANYTSQPDNGIALAYNAGHGQWQDIQLQRIAVLGYTAAAGFHSILMENVNKLIAEDIWVRYNTHGFAIKATNAKADGLDLGGNGSDCLILKADTSIALGAVNIGKVLCTALTPGDTGGVRITAGTASVGGPINIGQIITTNTFFGLLVDQASNSLTVNYLNVDSLQMDASGVGANTYACFQVSTSLQYANIGKIKCTNTGYIVEGNTGTFSNPDFINIGDIVGVNQHTAAISVALGGRWKFGTTNIGGTQASPVVAANNNAKLQWCLNCLYADGWSTTFATAAGGASIDLGIMQAAQFGATCSTSGVAGNVCTGNTSNNPFTWPAATWTSVVTGFPDAGYVVTCTGANGGTGVGALGINSYNATSVTTATAAITAAAAKFTNVECVGRE